MESKDDDNSVLRYLKQIAAALGAATTIVYIIGYGVVQFHFIRHHVSAISNLFQAQYLAAGLWYVIPLVVGALGLYRGFTFLVSLEGGTWLRRAGIIVVFLLLIASLFGPVLLLWFAPDNAWLKRQGLLDRIVIVSAIGGFTSLLAGRGFWAAWKREAFGTIPSTEQKASPAGKPSTSSFLRVVWDETSLFQLAFGLFIYTGAFLLHLFPFIPQALGGGRIESISFFVPADLKPAIESRGIAFEPNTDRTVPLRVLARDATQYYILIDNDKTVVEIGRDVLRMPAAR